MHSEYLRHLFLENELAEGRYHVDGKAITMTDIRAAIFSVGTTRDHVAPWRSVYKIHILTDTEVTFVLTSGGHNAGIVSESDLPGRTYQVKTKTGADTYSDPEAWASATPVVEGSWWPEWVRWLKARSGPMLPPPPMGAPEMGCTPLCDAPGTYVMQE